MRVTVETGTGRSNSWDQNQQIWMSHLCLGSEYCSMGLLFSANGKEMITPSGCDQRLMTFAESIVTECCVFLVAVTKRWGVAGYTALDKPLLSNVCASDGRKWAQALPGICPAGCPPSDSWDWHQHAPLSGATFMWPWLRWRGFANLIYSPRLAAASQAGRCHPNVHMERCSQRTKSILSKVACLNFK